MALKRVWRIADCICGKRLAPFLPELVPVLERFEGLVLDNDTRSKLLTISAATIDWLLRREKETLRLGKTRQPKPNSLLMRQIPIVTHSEHQPGGPGYVQVDLLTHDGG